MSAVSGLATLKLNFNVAKQVLSLELRRTFAYRFEFWFRFIGVLFANIAIAYFLWKAIYEHSGEATFQGFTFKAMIFYYVLVPLTENITRSHDPGFVSTEIYSGTLTRYLIFPMPFFLYKYSSTLATVTVAAGQMLIVVVGYALIVGFPAELQVSPSSLALGLLAAMVASLLNFFMVSCIEMVAFWADNIWSLSVMLMFCTRLLGGALLPLALFPERAQAIIPYTPFPYLVSFPVLTMMGKVAVEDWTRGMVILVIWIALLAFLHRIVWKRGSLKFSGVGN